MRDENYYQEHISALWAVFPVADPRAFAEYWRALEHCYKKLAWLEYERDEHEN
jgi:hypothetical protein